MSESLIETLKSFLEEDPRDSFTRFALALEYQKMGETAKTLELFNEILQQNPDYTGVYYHLGKLYEQLGNPQKASEVYILGIDAATRSNELQTVKELREALLDIE